MPAPCLKIFGRPELVGGDGAPLRFRTRKQLGVLVYLALEARRRPVSRDSLIDLLWPEVDRDRGAHSLSQALSTIRGNLGGDIVTRGGDGVKLVGDLTTDLDLVCSGRAPVPHGATPLDGAEGWAGAAFGHWVDGVRARCLELARSSLLERLKSARAEGDLSHVRECATSLYQVDPLSDAAVLAIAERCLVEGDRTGAIRLLRSHCERTERELGFGPSPELKRLLVKAEAGDRSAVGPESYFAAAARRRPEPFVGREADLAHLEGVWSEARAGALKTYLVTGPAGIGKSSLVRRFARSVAARTWPALVVACQEMGQNIPFAAVSDLILALSREPESAGTDPSWLAEASRVTPGLRSVYPGIPEPPHAPAESVRLRVAESIIQMMEAVGEGAPVLLVFDDVQYLDPASRDVLHVLLRRLERMSVMLLGTYRLSAHQRLTALGERPGGLSWEEKVHLAPLSRAETVELAKDLAGATGGQEAAAAIAVTAAELAQGNPYLAEMLVSDWRQNPDDSLLAAQRRGDGASASWRPSETMRKAFARQYHGLSGNALHMVHLLSVAGRAILGAEAAALLGLKESEVDRIALELIDRGVLRFDAGGFVFKNEMHRAFVYWAMEEDARKLYHNRLARSVNSSTPTSRTALEASHHFANAGLHTRAIDLAITGAKLALERGAYREAATALRPLLTLSDGSRREQLVTLIALSLTEQGQYRAASGALKELQGGPTRSESLIVVSRVNAEALHRGRLGEDQEIREAASLYLHRAEQIGSRVDLMKAIQINAEIASEVGDHQALEALREKARRMNDTSQNDQTRALAMLTEGYCLLVSGHAISAEEAFEASLEPLVAGHMESDLRRVWNGLGLAQAATGRFERAITSLNNAIRVAERAGDADGAANSWSNLATLLEDRGSFSSATNAYRRAAEAAASTGSPRRMAEVFVNAAGLSLNLGCLDEAHALAARAVTFSDESGLWRLCFGTLLLKADLALAESEHEAAWALLREAEGVRNGRNCAFANVGRYERLKRHYLLVSRSYDEMQAYSRSHPLTQACPELADRLEVEAFEEWAASVTDHWKGPSRSIPTIVDHKIPGLLSTLIAVGIRLRGLPTPSPGQSSAQLVQELFPELVQQPVPEAVAIPPLDVG